MGIEMVLLRLKIYLVFLTVFSLVACGGSGSGGPSSPRVITPPPPVSYDTEEYRKNYGLAQINALDAYEAGFTGEGVTVAVIDTGIVQNHPQISPNISPLSTNIVTGIDADVADTDGHGTAVAGVIAAIRDPNNGDNRNSHGVAFDAEILAINTADGDSCTTEEGCAFYDSDIANALDYARLNGVKVVNISLGGDEFNSPDLIQAYQDAVNAGMIIVVSAGNVEEGDTPEMAAVPENSASIAWADWANGQIIVAGALDRTGALADFSHMAGEVAKNVFLVAAGDEIPTIGLPIDGDPGYYLYTGTSFSAPHIAGAAALLYQAFPNLDGAEIAEILLTTATDLGDAGADAVYGSGLINMAEAFSPLGTTSIAVKTLRGDYTKVDLTNSILVGGSAFGSLGNLSDALEDSTILDGYNRSYHFDMGQQIVSSVNDVALEAFVDGRRGSRQSALVLSSRTRIQFSWREDVRFREVKETYFAHQAMARNTVHDLRMSVAYSLRPGEKITFAQGLSLEEGVGDYKYDDFLVTGKGSFSALLGREHTQMLAYESKLGQTSSVTFAFGHGRAFSELYGLEGESYLMMGRVEQGFSDALRVGFDLAFLKENGQVLGSLSEGALRLGRGASTAYVAAKLDWNLTLNLQVFAKASYGLTHVESAPASLIENVSTLSSGSFSTGLRGRDILSRGDHFTFAISQPLKVYGGSAHVSYVQSRDYQQDVLGFGSRNISLAPKGRAVDLELRYAFAHFMGARINLNLLHQFNPAHSLKRANSTALLFRLASTF